MSKLRRQLFTVKSLVNANFRFLFFALIAIGVGVGLTGLAKIGLRANAANNAKSPQTSGTIHKLVASYYSVRENLKATLMLSNQGPTQLPVRVHLFSPNGAQFELPVITLTGNEVRAIDLRQSINAGSSFEDGSVEVDYEGRTLELGGLVVLMNSAQSLVFEEELSEPAKGFASTRLEGLWWRPTGSTEVRLALSNNTSAAVAVTVRTREEGQGDSAARTITLAAHETRVQSTEDHNGNNELDLHGTVGGISISYAGTPGAVVAHGLIQEPAKGFSNVIDFADPQKAKLTRLDGGGLRFGTVAGKSLSQVAVLRNISNAPTTVSGRIPYTLSNGNKATATIPTYQLAPGEVKKVNLPAISSANQSTEAGLEFNYTGNPGSVIASALSLSSDRNQVFRVPMRDASVQASSTGTYPWSINDSSSTYIYIKNASDSVKSFTFKVSFQGGGYTLGLKSAQAGQTLAFNLRDLRDQQKKDGNGKVIPLNITHGQVHWSVQGAETRPLIGRAETADFINGTSTTSACFVYCPDSIDYPVINPDTFMGAPNTTKQFRGFRQDVDCYGSPSSLYECGGIWQSENTTVATINDGLANMLAAGVMTIYFSTTGTVYTPDYGNDACFSNTINELTAASYPVADVTISASVKGYVRNKTVPPHR